MDESAKLDILEAACFFRALEDALAGAADEGLVPGLMHLANGAELLHAVLAQHIEPCRDRLTASHRCHTLALAAGADPVRVAGEILGRRGGLSDGFAGTQHLADPESGFLTATGIVGSGVPLALGAAFAMRTEGGMGIAVFGDGALGQGAVLESFNLAGVMQLPVLFVLEDNGIAQTTRSSESQAQPVAERIAGLGLPICSTSVYDLPHMYAATRDACKIVRSGRPALLHVTLPRLAGHYYGGPVEQLEDPLASAVEALPDGDNLRAKAMARAEDVLAEAKGLPPADPAAMENRVEALRPWV